MTLPEHSQQLPPEALARFGFADPDAAACEISDLLEGVFGPFDPEAGLVWQLLDEEELSPKEMAVFFRQAAEADDPLEFLDRDSTGRGQLNAHMRVRWSTRQARAAAHPSSLAGRIWPSLPEASQEMVREGLMHLAAYEAAYVRKGQPRKNRADTALESLAGIYARQTSHPGSHWELPHGDRTYFVQFAVMVLKDHLDLTELEPGAISKRWERLKSKNKRGSDHL